MKNAFEKLKESWDISWDGLIKRCYMTIEKVPAVIIANCIRKGMMKAGARLQGWHHMTLYSCAILQLMVTHTICLKQSGMD